MKRLYPAFETFDTYMLPASGTHNLYVEESGDPKGKPVLFVHGGPGGATSPRQRRFFDPSHYRIIMFDQRGCGRSEPSASLEENTTWHIVDDMEQIRRHLQIDRWQLFGGSWGSTLSLAYAETYPERVTELVLRGIFMLRKRELDWFYQQGASAIFPDAWEEYLRPIPPADRHDMLSAYYARLTGEDADVRLEAAKAWTIWEKSTSYLSQRRTEIRKARENAQYSLAFARLECHYFMNGGFFNPESQLLDQIDALRDIPAVIIQGRYDVVCPMQTAWDLHQAWPEADFRVVTRAGHSAFEAGITHELVSATDQFRSS